MVSTCLKNICQNGNLPQIGVNIKKYLKQPPRIPHPGWRQKIIHWGVGGCLPKFKMPVLELEYYIMISHPIHPPTLGSGPFTQHPWYPMMFSGVLSWYPIPHLKVEIFFWGSFSSTPKLVSAAIPSHQMNKIALVFGEVSPTPKNHCSEDVGLAPHLCIPVSKWLRSISRKMDIWKKHKTTYQSWDDASSSSDMELWGPYKWPKFL